MASVDSDVSFESRLQWPSRSSFCSREDHRLARTRQVRALIVPQEEAVPLSFSRFVRTGALVDSRQFRMPAGHIRPARQSCQTENDALYAMKRRECDSTYLVRAMKTPIVMTEQITLRNTADVASASATRYWTANMMTIGMAGMAVVSTAALTIGLP